MKATTTARPPTVRESLARLEFAQKPGVGVPAYTRWVNRRVGRVLAAVAYCYSLSPNTVTAISAICSAAGLALLVGLPPSPLLGAGVALLLAFGYALDSADGQVARLGNTGSKKGEWLDHVVDAIRTPSIHLAVLAALWRWTDAPWWLLGTVMAYCVISVGQFMSQILAEQLAAGHVPVEQTEHTRQIARSVVLIPTDIGTLCWVFLIWGFPAAFFSVYTVLFVVNTVYSAASMRRKYAKLATLSQPAPTETMAP